MSNQKINSKDPMFNQASMLFSQVQSKVYSGTLSEDEIKNLKDELKNNLTDFLTEDLSDDVIVIELRNNINSFLENN